MALLGIVFTGLQSPQSYVALKEMKFKKWTVIQFSSGLMGTITIILLALAVRSVWALALGYAVENLIRCVVSYLLCPFRPRFAFDRASAQSLLTFSRGIFGLSFLYLIFSRADVFVLGKIYAASDLGVYTMAVYLVQVPASFVMGVLSQTLMPTFARIQDDVRRLNAILNRVTSILAIFGMPALVFVILSSHSILKLMYGPRYLTASTTLATAALVALLNVINSVITALFFALGRPQFHRRCALVMAVLMLVLIYPSVKEFGLMGGQIAALVAMVGGFASQLVRMERLTGLDLLQYGRSFPYTLAVSAGVLGVFLSLFRFWAMSNPIANLTLGLVACALTIGIFSKQLIRHLAT
jgi:O-antigen/teichoic acid export membrane protein